MSRGTEGTHGTAAQAHVGRLAWVLAITGVVLVAEVVGGLVSGSFALLADAGHMLTDAVGLLLALLATRLAARPATVRRTFGWQRAEVLAAMVNGMVVAGVGVVVLVEGIGRIAHPRPVEAGLMLAVALGGLVANAEDLIQTEGASFEARRMDVLGSNGHGGYVGEANFLPGGDIACTCTHTRTDGAVTKGTLTIHADGSTEETAESAKGQVRLEAKTDADGKLTVQLRDLAQADTPLIPIDVSIADGVAVFDLGNGEKGRARVK